MTRGGVPSLKELYKQEVARAADWYEIYVREAHPGERYPAHTTYEEKRSHAGDFKQLEDIPWPVLVDDVDGTVHRAYGGLPNSAYLIDADGLIAFKDQWASAATLATALKALKKRGGRGAPITTGQERMMHLLGPMAFGWPAVQRGGSKSVRDFYVKTPPMAVMLAAGHRLEPVLGPLARHSKPFPTPVKAVVGLGLIALVTKFVLPRIRTEQASTGAGYSLFARRA